MSPEMSNPIFREQLKKKKKSSICFLLQMNKEIQVLVFQNASRTCLALLIAYTLTPHMLAYVPRLIELI